MTFATRLLKAAFVILIAFNVNLWALAKTDGTPLGGMGTGWVVFNAINGNFGASGKNPPAGADSIETPSASSGFHFYANGKSIKKATTTDEDAKCPLYTANFGDTGGVNFSLTAFGPYLPGDASDNFKLATSPLAFFEITAKNNGGAAVEAAVAMEFANSGGGASLLGGATSGTLDSGNQAISFAGTNDNAYLAVTCDGAAPLVSLGAMGTFLIDGKLANTDGNAVAAKCTIAANGAVRFKFILAWWRKFESTTDRYGSGKPDKENYFYHNYYANSKEAAAFGKLKFDAVKTGITSFVNRLMATNFPDWYKDRLLNNTYPLIHNSQCAQDGRIAFWEGKYGIIGTIDQGQHAALFYTFNWPQVQWQELQYWKRTAHKEDSCKGQIHHDFNTGVNHFSHGSDVARFMCPWDNTLRDDYWWFKNTRSWADLNSMFIFKAYELMLATGNLDSTKTYFPQVKQTADRILQQSGTDKIPFNSHSTYDESTDNGATFNLSPEYNGGVALATYLAIIEIAKFVGEDSVATRFKGYYDVGRTQYKQKFASNAKYATGRDASEGDVAGYSWARYYCLEPIMDSAFITEAHQKLWLHYYKRTENKVDTLRAKLGKWGFYTCDHWGGVEIAIGKPDTALIIHKWDYDYYYAQSPKLVFWQNLRKEITEKPVYASYMTGPTVWRSYFQMLGYLLDNANNRLWIRPSLPTSMNKKITKGLLLNPKALGTLDYDETPNGGQRQSIHVAFDSPVSIKEIVLKNNTSVDQPGVTVKQNGASVAATAQGEGSGFERNIRVKFNAPIQLGSEGIDIAVFNGIAPAGKGNACSYKTRFFLSIGDSRLSPGFPLHYSADASGPLTIEIIGLNGAKMGTLFNGVVSAGNHSLIWNGRLVNGKKTFSGSAILRLKSTAGEIYKMVLVTK